MNTLQTVWTALTTENEGLTMYAILPLYFLEAYILMKIFTTILSINATKKQKVMYVFIESLLSIISRFILPQPFNTYANLIILVLSIKLIFKTNIFQTIIALIIPFLIEIFVEILFSKLYFAIFKVDYVVGMNIPLHRLVGTLLIYLIVYFIYLLLKQFKFSLSKIQILNKRDKILIISNIVLGIILVAAQLYILAFYTYTLPTFISILSIVSILVYVALSIYTIFTVSKLESTSMKLEEQMLYNKTLQILHDNIRAFKHDFFNIVQGIGGYIGKEDMDGLKQYYEKLLEDCQQVNNLSALSPSVVNNPAIYNILANNYHKADELGIKINLDVFTDLNELNINSYELTRILGILINNAIEASKDCEEKVINIEFRKSRRKHMDVISIENTYNEKDIDIDEIFKKGYSTKVNNSGIGLWEIRQILKKHNNLNLYTTKNDEYFKQDFEIYY